MSGGGSESQSSQHLRGALRYKTESESNVFQPQAKRATTKAGLLLGFAPSVGVKFRNDIENVPINVATPSVSSAVTPGYDLSPEETIIRRKYLAGSTPHAAKDGGDDENGVNMSSAFKSVLELKKHNYEFNLARPSPMAVKDTNSSIISMSRTENVATYLSPQAAIADSKVVASSVDSLHDSGTVLNDDISHRNPTNAIIKSSPEIIIQKELFSNTVYGDSPAVSVYSNSSDPNPMMASQSASLDLCLGLDGGDSSQSTPASSPLPVSSRSSANGYSRPFTPHQSTFQYTYNQQQCTPLTHADSGNSGIAMGMPMRRSSPVTAPSPSLSLGGSTGGSPSEEIVQRFRDDMILRSSEERKLAVNSATPYHLKEGDMSVQQCLGGSLAASAATKSVAFPGSNSNRGFVPITYNAMEKATCTRAPVGVSLSKPGLSSKGSRTSSSNPNPNPNPNPTSREIYDLGPQSTFYRRPDNSNSISRYSNQDSVQARVAPVVTAPTVVAKSSLPPAVVASHKADLDSSDSSAEERKEVANNNFVFGSNDIGQIVQEEEEEERGLADLAGYTPPVRGGSVLPAKQTQSPASLLSSTHAKNNIGNKNNHNINIVADDNDGSRLDDEGDSCDVDEEVDRNTELNSSSVYDPNASALFTVATEISIDSNFSMTANSNVAPKFVIASRKISKDCSDDMKEITLVADPGSYATISLTFGNEKDRRIQMRPRALQMRFDPLAERSRQQHHADDFENNAFEVSPRLLDIPVGSERTMYVTFSPRKGASGIYSGALKVKAGKKTFVLLLRGEAVSDVIDNGRGDNDDGNNNDDIRPAFEQQPGRDPCPDSSGRAHIDHSCKLADLHSRLEESYFTGIGTYANPPYHPERYTDDDIFFQQQQRRQQQEDDLALRASSNSGLEGLLGGRDANGNFLSRNPYAIGSFPVPRGPDTFNNKNNNNNNIYHAAAAGTDYTNMRTSAEILRSSFDNRPAMMAPLRSSFELNQANRNPSIAAVRRPRENMNAPMRRSFDKSNCSLSDNITFGGGALRTSIDSNRAAAGDIVKTQQRLRQWLNTEKAKTAESVGYFWRGGDSSGSGGRVEDIRRPITRDAPAEEEAGAKLVHSNHPTTAAFKQQQGASEGIFFRREVADYGSVPVGSLSRLKVELCNATDEEVAVLLSDPKLPFVLVHAQVSMRPRSYMRIPVRFVPVAARLYEDAIVAQTADGRFRCTIVLRGSSN